MKIFINNAPIDFSLENEKTAFDALSGILSWVQAQKLVVSQLLLNEKEIFYPPLAPTLKEVAIDEIETIRCEVLNASTYGASLALDAGQELLTLSEALSETALSSHLDAISTKLAWIRRTLIQCGSLLKLETTFAPLAGKLKNLESDLFAMARADKSFDQAALDKSVKEVLQKLHDHLLTLQTRALSHELAHFKAMQTSLREQGTPATAENSPASLTNIAGETALRARLVQLKDEAHALLETMQQWTVKTATAFQQGDTGIALAFLSDLSQSISLFLSLQHTNLHETHENADADAHTASSAQGETRDSRLLALEEILSNIAQALENKDMVEISDLIEYELTPALSAFETRKISSTPSP